MIEFVQKTYYRYTLMTGIYMLGAGERFILHSSMITISVLFFRFVMMDFLRDYLGLDCSFLFKFIERS